MWSQASRLAVHLRLAVIALGLTIGFLLMFFHDSFPLPATLMSKSTPVSSPENGNTFGRAATIPNIVHFVYLVPSTNLVLDFEFRQFVAIYSAWLYLQPEDLYIHTNVVDIEETLRKSTNPYTNAISKLPGVRFTHQTPKDHTESGVAIDKLPNQSDFVRTVVLGKMGGVYLDEDSYVLRDLKRLRNMGFENVLGLQDNDQICPAVILSTPGNILMKAYHDLQDKVFNPNKWALHATDLLTTLAQEFQVPDDGQVMIMPHDIFFPGAWLPDNLRTIYQVHEDLDALPAVNNKDTKNLPEFYKDFQLYGPETWKRDWRSSYVLHVSCDSPFVNFTSSKYRCDTMDKSKTVTLIKFLTGVDLRYPRSTGR